MRALGLVLYFLILIVLVVAAVIFAKDNAYEEVVSFVGYESPKIPLWMIIFASFFVGVLTSVLLLSLEILKLKISRHKFKKSFEEIKDQLVKLQSKTNQDSAQGSRNDDQ
jgi:uncharacterized integral membrane protein